MLRTIRSILSSHASAGIDPIPWFNANTAIAGAMMDHPSGAGDPTVRVLECLASADGCIATGVWESTAGKHQFYFDFDEIIYFIEGEVHVIAGGKSYTFRAGDVAFIPAGVQMNWDVPNYVRKIWMHRYPRFPLLFRALRKVRQVTHIAPLHRDGRSAVT